MLIGYVTVAEADAYIAGHFSYSNRHKERWEGLSEEDKAVYLQQSVEAMDVLPFHFRKVSQTQPHAFPRTQYTSIPEPVKYAQIENAIQLSEEVDNSQYEQSVLRNVTSYTIGPLSETFAKGSQGGSVLSSMKAAQLLKPYLSGGYMI